MATKDNLNKVLSPIIDEDETKKESLPTLLPDEAKKRQAYEATQATRPIEVEHTIETDPNKIAVAKVEVPQSIDYEKIMQMTDPDKPLSPQEKAAQERRRKGDAIMSALGDGISSLANIYFASEGAYNMLPDPSQSLSAKSKERWEKIKAERDAKDLRFAQRIKEREDARKQREKELRDFSLKSRALDIDEKRNQELAQYRESEAQRKAEEAAQKMDSQTQVNNARAAYYYNLAKNGGKKASSNRYAKVRISPTESVDIPEHQYNEMIDALWTFIPELDKKTVGTMRKDKTRAAATASQIKNYVLAELQNNEAMQAFVRSLAEDNAEAQPTSKPTKEAKQEPETKPTTPKHDWSQYEETKTKDWSQYKRK
jgi:hypothetical protein